MADRTCSVEGCPRAPGPDLLCATHRYYRNKHGRLPNRVIIWGDERSRVMAKVEQQANGCWLWTGYCGPLGYGRVQFRGRTQQAHRAVWILYRGDIPDGLHLDHLCFVSRCVNPDHLEPVTPTVNADRVRFKSRPNLAPYRQPATECRAGHVMSGENLYVSPKGRRVCRACKRRREAPATR